MSQNGTNDSKAPTLAPSKPPQRRLVVMFDGTSNTRQSMTNVARMFEAIDDSHRDSYKPWIDSEVKDCLGPASAKIVQCGKCNQPMLEPPNYEGDDSKAYFRAGVPCGSCYQLVVERELQPDQEVKYITGVGTDYKRVISWVTGQTFGYGLSDKIKEGYTWLCEKYEEGDDVFVFGFSRGAFAARSLVSLLHKCDGVLKKLPKSVDHNKVVKTAYAHYKRVKSTDGKTQAELRNDCITYLKSKDVTIEPLHHLQVQVKMLGVWDTVGALGIRFHTRFPIINNIIDSSFIQSILRECVLSRTHYQFHDQGLSCIVDNAYHALALDECREHFEPTLWTSRASEDQEVKQVWFAGSHCNVGGGADLDDNDDPDDLWQYSYVWMQRHAEKHGLRFFWSYESPATRQANSHLRTRRVSFRKPEPSYENFGLGFYSWFNDPFKRITNPELAMLHWSVLERMEDGEKNRQAEAENNATEAHTVLDKIRGLFSYMHPWNDFGRTSDGFGAPQSKPTGYLLPKSLVGNDTYAEFKATVIPEGSTEVIAPGQVDAKGTPKWHIETDDVMASTKWGLEPRSKATKEVMEKGKEKVAKKLE